MSYINIISALRSEFKTLCPTLLFYKASPRCAMLNWGSEMDEFHSAYGDFDIIIGADVVFWPQAVPLLFETVAFLMKKNVSSNTWSGLNLQTIECDS